MNNLNLKEWKKEIVKNKKNVVATTSNNDKKYDDHEELISYLEKAFVARLIHIYSGNVAATKLYNDKKSGQLELRM